MSICCFYMRISRIYACYLEHWVHKRFGWPFLWLGAKKIYRKNCTGTYSTVQLKLVVKTKFPFICPTCFTQIPQGEFLWNSFPSFSQRRGKLISWLGNSFSPLGKHNLSIFTQFHPILPWFPNDSPRFPSSPCAVFNTTSQVYSVSEHLRYITISLHVGLSLNEDSQGTK